MPTLPNRTPHPAHAPSKRAAWGLRLLATATFALLVGTSHRVAAGPAVPSLDGRDVDFDYDGTASGHPLQSWLGRAFVHRLVAADPKRPRPLVVFIHGTNALLIKYRWMGGGREGDVRRIVAELMESGAIEPVVVAGPSSVIAAAIVNARTSWPSFDLADFVQRLEAALGERATIDRSRIVVVGHSGGGCNPHGGIAAAVHGTLTPLAAIAVDTCMDPEVGIELARAPAGTRVVVTWQTQGWATRPFDLFLKAFRRESEPFTHDFADARVLDHLRVTEPMPHDAMVPLSLRKWLPRLLPAAPAPTPASMSTSGTSLTPAPRARSYDGRRTHSSTAIHRD